MADYQSPSQTKRPATRAAFGVAPSGYDPDLYESGDPRSEKYLRHVVEPDDDLAEGTPAVDLYKLKKPGQDSVTAPQHFLDEAASAAAKIAEDPFKKHRAPTIAERESEYHARRLDRTLSPRRVENEKETGRNATPAKDGADVAVSIAPADGPPPVKRRRKRWDLGPQDVDMSKGVESKQIDSSLALEAGANVATAGKKLSRWDDEAPKVATSRWDETPVIAPGQSSWNATPSFTQSVTPSRWDETPKLSSSGADGKRSRWDETPVMKASVAVPGVDGTLSVRSSQGALPPEVLHASRWQADVEERNRPLSNEDLDRLLPTEGYSILTPPASYIPIRTPARKLMATPAPLTTPYYALPEEGGISRNDLGIPVELPEALRGIEMKPEDYANFAKVLEKHSNEDELSSEEQRERKIMRLLLKIKNGSPPVRKVALRQITDKAREFGPGPLFNQILPLLMSPTLEDQERHLYVKVIDRILNKLDDLVRPYVHKILVVILPLLIDEDYYARVEGREIISNLAKAAGLATMITTMRPEIDNPDEYVRNTTARAFAVLASALGIPRLQFFLKAVCRTKKSWHARHTGIKIVQQIAILMGFGVLPHLKSLVEIVGPGLTDEQAKVRTVAALALAALAEACTPFGFESFEQVLRPLWEGIRLHRSKTLAAFLKAIGCVIPLMDAEYASYCAREVNIILIREFQSTDEDMKKIVLKVVKQCVSCEGVEPEFVRQDIAPEYFRCFWVRRIALDRRNYKLVVETSLEIAVKIGGGDVIGRLVEGLKDESEPYRKMVVEAVDNIATELGLSDLSPKLEERLMDGMLWAFQEHGNSGVDESRVVLNAFSTIVKKLGTRAQPYLTQIVSMVKWRLNNKSAKVREYAADLISETAVVMKLCDEESLMSHLGVILFEFLGEEFPDVLGSILRALKSIVEVIGIEQMKPPIQDLLPRLTPILKNRHEKVQENCILLVGQIADRGARFVSPREWMRISFDLLELLKAPRKTIRKSAVSTFGHIAKAIGPSEVLVTLLNNLKVQERTQRVCTTVAIAIVAEKCKPYTVVPALMNEYRIPEMNVQNGVLKSFSFLFEYIGDMSKDYIYAITAVLEDALIDRDLVHRQTACSAVGHLALGVRACGVEDALMHLLNHVWPNIFETSPHVVNSVVFAIEGCMVALGPGTILLYALQGLFHPARKVREVYWRIYNRLYIYGQDSLVPFYPQLPSSGYKKSISAEQEDDTVEMVEERDLYRRHELYLIV